MAKVFINNEVIKETPAPTRGETWLADSRITGFGLRVYRTNRGIRKALGIRVRDSQGKLVRKNFPIDRMWNGQLIREDVKSIEQYQEFERKFMASELVDVEEVREWARSEIQKLKGRKTLEAEDAERYENANRVIRDVTLERGAIAILSNLERMKVSAAYRDRLSKLFFNSISKHLRETKIADFTHVLAGELMDAMELSPSNRRTLQAFVGRVFDISLSYGVRSPGYFDARRAWRRNRDSGTLEETAVLDTVTSQFVELFKRLETESQYREQALCLRLYFSTHSPLTRLMRAKWMEFGVREVSSFFSERKIEVLIWQRSSRLGRHERFHGETIKLIADQYRRVTQTFPHSEYCFPSSYGRTVGHIRSIDHVWTKVLYDMGLAFVTPRETRFAYHETRAYKSSIWL